jgi:hypothetical protein
MQVGIHTPSWPVVIVSLILAILAIIGYFVGAIDVGFWIAIFAYVVGALGVMVKT